MYNTKSYHRNKNSSNQEKTVWNDVLIQFRRLPKSRQDEILLRIYKRVATKPEAKHFSLLLQAKA